jgi:citrate lyase subunit beta/citryl-CoA lyase
VARAFRDLDWGGKPRVCRVNDVRSPDCWRDLTEVLAAAGGLVDAIIVPKVESDGDLAFVDRLLGQIEPGLGRAVGSIALEAQIETAMGLVNCEVIARATPRLTSLVFGPGDYAASLGMPVDAIGVPNEWDRRYPGARFGYAMSRIVTAARAAGIRAIDGPYADFRDDDGLRASCWTSRALGFDGKWCIHPGQIAIVNEAFTPSAAEIERAASVVRAYDAALKSGSGAARTGSGTMIDAASLRMARATLAAAGE